MYVPDPKLLQNTLADPASDHDACGVGVVADIAGRASNRVLRIALEALVNMRHRGACGCEANTGDGAGVLMQIPHTFLQRVCRPLHIELPHAGSYGAGMIFLPQDEATRLACQTLLTSMAIDEGLSVLGWRSVPTRNGTLGATARAGEPVVRQLFIGRPAGLADDQAFERTLYIVRRRAERAIAQTKLPGVELFNVASLSQRTIVYKGMFTSEQLEEYYPDLNDSEIQTALALVHSRFSTNTFPSWKRAQPFRYSLHNGEINTIRGNYHWMRAREASLASELFGDDMVHVLPVIDPDGSDSAMLDNVLEMLVLAGRPLAHAMMMMVPEAWEHNEDLDDSVRAFYEYHSCLMEPWDGPASIAFTDGIQVGAVLDRNGLRPSRYTLTSDGLLVLASETGAASLPLESIVAKGRLEPGKMVLVDTRTHEFLGNDDIKRAIASTKPYRQWLSANEVCLESLPIPKRRRQEPATLLQRQQAFGYTFEDLNMILGPMARDGVEPIGSMGTDTPPAVLSSKPQLLYSYFKQLFAQVTNPPIDASREAIAMGSGVALGTEGNLLAPDASSCRMVRLPQPILTDEEMAKLRAVDLPGLRAVTLPALFDATRGPKALAAGMDAMCIAADEAVKSGAAILVISDRGVTRERAAIPALLALSGVHHHLVRSGTRTRVGLAVESAEPREVHHFALMVGYGAGAINPYLAFETLDDMIAQGMLPGLSREEAQAHYIKATVKGITKVMSKMGICTLDGYRGSQIFEALGLAPSLVDRYFTGTAARIGGANLEMIAQEALARHRQGFPERGLGPRTLDAGGQYQWRAHGEHHTLNPLTIYKLQTACRSGDYETFREYSALINDPARPPVTLRALLDLDLAAQPIPLEQVESVESICRRFKTGGMSYGSISKEAHEALAIAMNRIGGKSNSGEGGEDPERFVPSSNGDSRSSAIKQVASGRFGVTSDYLNHAEEIQIKIAQGAKPGEGGQLPGRKVYPWIARVRLSTPGVGLISPPPHHDIYSIEDLAELIYDLKMANPRARISVKLVSEVGVGTIAAGVAKGHADVILVSGFDGGTGASPQTGIKHAGLPWELAVSETHQTLLVNDLRSRVVLETDGQLRTGRDVVVGALLGAEEFGFATAPLVTLGCTMMRVCHLDTCPVGVATQNPELRRNFSGDPQYVVNFMRFVAQEVREMMAQLGYRRFDEMVGHPERLRPRENDRVWKAAALDFTRILQAPAVPAEVGRFCQISQQHGIEESLDARRLLEICEPALSRREPIRASLPIGNADRAVGAMLGGELTRRYGPDGLPDETIHLKFNGSAGQSFGAFVPKGITLEVEGDANDYAGKGLSGGTLVIYPPASAHYVAEDNIIIGNVALYGATSGKAYIRGKAGERFCVRNSGATAVVEGVGDHGCEYMTGGRVVVLGPTGRNFAAGMSGGIAYVFDEAGDFARRCNREIVDLDPLTDADRDAVHLLIAEHAKRTGSQLAERILNQWDEFGRMLVKVFPRDYKRMVQTLERVEKRGLVGEDAIMVAFEENKNDLARVTGN